MYGKQAQHSLLEGSINSYAGSNIQAIDKSDTWHSKRHTEKAIKIFSDDVQWDVYYFLFIFIYACPPST